MPKLLRSFNDLVRIGWNDFIQQWNQTILIASWLLFIPILLLAIILLSTSIPSPSTQWVIAVLDIIQAFFTLWIIIRIVKWYLAELHEDKSHAHEHEAVGALKALPQLLWITILKSLAILGGFLFAIFPGFWLNNLLNFSELAYLEDRQKGAQALHFSANLVKGRWWATFGRLFGIVLIWVLIYLGLYITISYLVFLISGFNADPSQLAQLTDPSLFRQNTIISAADNILQALCQIVLLPLFFAWQIRLYKSLKDSR